MENIRSLKQYLRHECLDELFLSLTIPGIQYTTRNIFGKYIIWVREDGYGDVTEKRYELKSYYAKICFTENGADRRILKQRIIEEVSKKNREMCGGITDFQKLVSLTCDQLCDWEWLPRENGEICVKVGDHYEITLVKYAVVLDENGNPVDTEIKEVKK